jgi:hypothetical protein
LLELSRHYSCYQTCRLHSLPWSKSVDILFTW